MEERIQIMHGWYGPQQIIQKYKHIRFGGRQIHTYKTSEGFLVLVACRTFNDDFSEIDFYAIGNVKQEVLNRIKERVGELK